mgnify:CR=1 FL=1
MTGQATIVFTIHRPEMIALTADIMQRHQTIFLEEPPAEGFEEMLSGRLTIDDYLAPIDLEYPEFSKRMCQLERELYDSGARLVQVEPFLEELIAIHEFFAEGSRPADIKPQSLREAVYISEKNATGALLAYYRTVMTGNFDESVAAIIAFARRDGARFRLRDKLRTIAIGNRIDPKSRSYIEAGVIHYSLYPMLKKKLGGKLPVKSVFAAKEAIRQLGRKGHLYGPGDLLTLRYILHPNLTEAGAREALLAGRALIYAKLIGKEEISAQVDTFPHIRNELDTIAMVNNMSFEDCRKLFPMIRRRSTDDSFTMVQQYLKNNY